MSPQRGFGLCHLLQCDLTKVALVSRRFNAIAERVLDLEVVGSGRVPKRRLLWCDAMKRNQLYDVPRKLSIRWRIDTMFKCESLPHWCSLLSDNICRRLTLLDTLELFIGSSSENATPAVDGELFGDRDLFEDFPCCKPKPMPIYRVSSWITLPRCSGHLRIRNETCTSGS